ncbi:MAG: 23S rRNA (uracil(1939)-C(5))-methyltransferase RlmD [Lachnospiraceae bacterium]|nr:23S rRNA (uracil(1939)-C(5))-methyltransferase RlmD [Lachnospiraceae bacterium]
MYQKNEVIKLQITDLGSDGEGIGKIDGFPFFVKGAVPGDEIEAIVMKVKKNLAYARLSRIIKASPDRADAPCPHFGKCGGCRLMHLSYEAQLRHKEEKVHNALVRIGGLKPPAADAPLAADMPLHYRNKAQYPFGTDAEGKPICGFYAERSHRIIPAERCLLGDEEDSAILTKIREWMLEHGIPAYDELSGKGLLRHVLLRRSRSSGQRMVCLVINAQKLPHAEELCRKLADLENMHSVCISVNTKNTNVIMGEEIRCLWGEERITDSLRCGDDKELFFTISPLSFYQVNPLQTEKLYSAALEYAQLGGGEIVWDLYCGIGTISLFLAGKAGKVYGVEIVPQAVEDARENARRNGIDNAEFFCGAAEDLAPGLLKRARPDIVVVDPPRKGLDAACLETILTAAPRRVVYVSCDPATLARDLHILEEGGYRLERYRICDMFPQTSHVETVALLSKLSEAKHHIEVKVDMDELDLPSAEAKATYKEIQDWVQEMYGFHVTNLNIAQVKQKHGIIERENYNKPKSPDSKQPGCPEKKVKAIEDAMRHFQMIE